VVTGWCWFDVGGGAKCSGDAVMMRCHDTIDSLLKLKGVYSALLVVLLVGGLVYCDCWLVVLLCVMVGGCWLVWY